MAWFNFWWTGQRAGSNALH